MHEDWTVEAGALAGRPRLLCIASAGCTAFALAARGHEVHAVDVNPAQIAYARARLAGAPMRDGVAERALDRARCLGPWVGWSGGLVEEFLEMTDTARQEACWRARMATRLLRVALAAGLAPLALAAGLPAGTGALLAERLRRGVGRFPNATNPYLRWLLTGADRPGTEPRPVGTPRELAVADAVDYLERGPAAAFDGFALSNVLDMPGRARRARLMAALRRAARPGAVAALRSLGRPADSASAERAAEDRTMLWGSIEVLRLGIERG